MRKTTVSEVFGGKKEEGRGGKNGDEKRNVFGSGYLSVQSEGLL